MAYEKKEKPGCMIYWEMWDILQRLEGDKLEIFVPAIRNYAQYGKVPDFGGDEKLDFAWFIFREKLDRDDKKYKNTSNQKQLAGWTSDFKKNYAPKHGIDPENKEELEKYIQQKLAEVNRC